MMKYMNRIFIGVCFAVGMAATMTSCYKEDINTLYSRDVLVKGSEPTKVIKELNTQLELLKTLADGLRPESVSYVITPNGAKNDTTGVELVFNNGEKFVIALPQRYKGPSLREENGYLYIDGEKTNVRANIKGDKGDKGEAGPKGDKGDAGTAGEAGPKGDKGDTGAAGEAGPKGDKGDAGADGRFPILGARKDTEAMDENKDVLYWTYKYAESEQPEFILDSQGNKIPVTGASDERGDSFIESIAKKKDSDDILELKLVSGDTYYLPLVKDLLFALDRSQLNNNDSYKYITDKDSLLFTANNKVVELPFKVGNDVINIRTVAPAGWDVNFDKDGKKLKIQPPSKLDKHAEYSGKILVVGSNSKGKETTEIIRVEFLVRDLLSYFYNPLATVPTQPASSKDNKLDLPALYDYWSNNRDYKDAYNCHYKVNILSTIGDQDLKVLKNIILDTNKERADGNFISIHDLKTGNIDIDIPKDRSAIGKQASVATVIMPEKFPETPIVVPDGNRYQIYSANAVTPPNHSINNLDQKLCWPIPDNVYAGTSVGMVTRGVDIYRTRLHKISRHFVLNINFATHRLGLNEKADIDADKISGYMTNVAVSANSEGQLGNTGNLYIPNGRKHFKYDKEKNILSMDIHYFGLSKTEHILTLYYNKRFFYKLIINNPNVPTDRECDVCIETCVPSPPDISPRTEHYTYAVGGHDKNAIQIYDLLVVTDLESQDKKCYPISMNTSPYAFYGTREIYSTDNYIVISEKLSHNLVDGSGAIDNTAFPNEIKRIEVRDLE